MLDPNSVITQAFDGHIVDVADEMGLTYKRANELLGKDNPYPKLWRVLTPLGLINPDRLALVKADFNARCDRVLLPFQKSSTSSSVHKEITEAMQKILDKAPANERRKEILEAIAELSKELQKCDVNDNC